ncbi:MAG: 2-dehydropantoate 2-reductase [Chloroflexota bacterium]
MRIVIIGAGGVGGYFGGRLAQAGAEVQFVARGEHLHALRSRGLRVESIRGDFSIFPVQANDTLETFEAAEMILLAVKAWQVPQAIELLRPRLSGEAGVIYLGNGVEAVDQLRQALGAQHVLGGLTRISAAIAGPGHIRHVGIEPYIAFNELDGRAGRRVERLRQAFEAAAGVSVGVPDDIQAAIWEKFVFIAAVSGVGAAARAPIGALRHLDETRALLEAAIDETLEVGRALGVRLGSDIAARTLAFIDTMAPGVTASMQRDIMEGRPSELAAQSGAVVRLGQAAGVPTPVHAFLYASLLPQELKARGEMLY